MDMVRKWYDGYCFGNAEVDNPWSVINYIELLRINSKAFVKGIIGQLRPLEVLIGKRDTPEFSVWRWFRGFFWFVEYGVK